MPNFRTHTSANLFALIAADGLLLYNGIDFTTVGQITLGGVLSTFLLSPDLDLSNSTSSADWGILEILFLPYSKSFHHRGISHMPVVGTLTRYLYIVLLLVLVGLVINIVWGVNFSFDPEGILGAIGYIFIGSVFVDSVHYLLDMTLHGHSDNIHKRFTKR